MVAVVAFASVVASWNQAGRSQAQLRVMVVYLAELDTGPRRVVALVCIGVFRSAITVGFGLIAMAQAHNWSSFDANTTVIVSQSSNQKTAPTML